ncbi:MAG TPA: Ada metal-binding domain-containing protein, partial [Vicinamibacteria bacterium]|nr:Ada metal-binding domain-containing protein [Vicinamibacteria bacterium]
MGTTHARPSPAGPSGPLPSRREMERAFLGSDATYDGVFLTGVRTTGIFCRPSCRARKPRPENVEFFRAAKEAVFAGYRPCRKCHPLETPGAAPDWVRRLLDRVEGDPEARIKDADLRRMGLDPARVR